MTTKFTATFEEVSSEYDTFMCIWNRYDHPQSIEDVFQDTYSPLMEASRRFHFFYDHLESQDDKDKAKQMLDRVEALVNERKILHECCKHS